MCYGIIYKIENKINGKIYIGQTVRTFYERYRGDIRNTHNEHLKRSIEIYGVENFEIDEYVCKCDTKEELDRVEKFYIYVYDTANPEHGYNLTFGGEGGIPNEETRKKLSESMKKALADPETKKKQSENIKKALADPEIKKRQSEGIRKAYENPEVKKKISENTKRVLADPEIKKRQSENTKRALADPEIKKRQSEGIRKAYENPEYKEKISEKLSGTNNYRAKPIVQLDKQGNFIQKWDYIGQAAKELNINNISACCRGKIKSASGYIWIYEAEYLDLLQYAFF